ncbi:hypothetical protein GCM10009803_09200 [Microbacterium ginsengiterrae]
MLAVCIHLDHDFVVMRPCVAKSRTHGASDSEVIRQRQYDRPRLTRAIAGGILRPVVDDHAGGSRHDSADVLYNVRDGFLLIQRRDDDEN